MLKKENRLPFQANHNEVEDKANYLPTRIVSLKLILIMFGNYIGKVLTKMKVRCVRTEINLKRF